MIGRGKCQESFGREGLAESSSQPDWDGKRFDDELGWQSVADEPCFAMRPVGDESSPADRPVVAVALGSVVDERYIAA